MNWGQNMPQTPLALPAAPLCPSTVWFVAIRVERQEAGTDLNTNNSARPSLNPPALVVKPGAGFVPFRSRT